MVSLDDDLRRHDAYTVPEYSRVGLGQPGANFRPVINDVMTIPFAYRNYSRRGAGRGGPL